MAYRRVEHRRLSLCSPHVVCRLSSAILHKWCCLPLLLCGRVVVVVVVVVFLSSGGWGKIKL